MPPTATVTVTIANKLGMHARPAMMFVQAASAFEADIQVCRCDQCDAVDGKSIMQVMMLAATCGTELCITATGDDAETAVAELSALVESKFQEE